MQARGTLIWLMVEAVVGSKPVHYCRVIDYVILDGKMGIRYLRYGKILVLY